MRRRTSALMIQGTGSDVGKSVLVAGLCRAFVRRGMSVRPFKPQNMSNNIAVTVDGGQIGRAQAVQAMACGVEPHTDMNPVLLKPQRDSTSQLVVQGHGRGTLGSANFRSGRGPLLAEVLQSHARLRNQCDIVVVEGAGSPAEINLRAGDIANMGFARAAHVPVVLAGDIDRGGVIASIVGTRHILAPEDAAMIGGFIINRFRGDPALFADGYEQIEKLSGWRGFGVVPWLLAAARLPSEDSIAPEPVEKPAGHKLRIACPITPGISNFDDLDPLKLEPGVDLRMIPPGRPIPADTDVIILVGSRATIADIEAIRAEGWDIDILAHHRRGGQVFGICGGYQMLGRTVSDPKGVEGIAGAETVGLGLLDIETAMQEHRHLKNVSGEALGAPFDGYEMHMGVSHGPDTRRPLVRFEDGRVDGAISADGRVSGTYVHGLFSRAELRTAWLARLGVRSAGVGHRHVIEQALDEIAETLESCLDLDAMLALAATAGQP